MSNQNSPEDALNNLGFAERRRQRKQKLREDFFKDKAPAFQMTWRILLSSGLLGLGVWVVSLPLWNITNANQIEVQGTKLLAAKLVKDQIKIEYPQYIFKLRPQAIATQLEQKAPVYNTVVKRSLFPLKVTVIVQEREPVATATLNGEAGFIDAKGVWIRAKSYPSNIKKPDILVVGTDQRVLEIWRRLYRQISRSSIKISKLDFRKPTNLILTTNLGLVYCGDYTYAKMEKQIQMLDRLRNLPKSSAKIKYTHIDLINPDYPVVDGVTAPLSDVPPKP